MARRFYKTTADYLVIALSPALIMALVTSLVFFLLLVFYRGQFHGRLQYIFFLFIFAAVLIARIAIDEGRERAALFSVALAVAVAIVLNRFSDLGLFANLGLMALIWWCADRLTWDCTVIDEQEDASGEGLLQTMGLDQPRDAANNTSADADVEPLGVTSHDSATGAIPKTLWRRAWEHFHKTRAPGIWVIYFSLAALPIFGLGQRFIAESNSDARRAAFRYLFIYVASALGLLLATSFLGLRRYLRQRRVEMPDEMAVVWVATGGALIAILLAFCTLLPRPSAEYAVSRAPSPFYFGSPLDLRSTWMSWGEEGVEDSERSSDATLESQSHSEQIPPSNEQQSSSTGQASSQSSSRESKSDEGSSDRQSQSDNSSHNQNSQNSSPTSQQAESQNQKPAANDGSSSSDAKQGTQGSQSDSAQNRQGSPSSDGNSAGEREQSSGEQQQAEPSQTNAASGSHDQHSTGEEQPSNNSSQNSQTGSTHSSPQSDNQTSSSSQTSSEVNEGSSQEAPQSSPSRPPFNPGEWLGSIWGWLGALFKVLFYLAIVLAGVWLFRRYKDELVAGFRELLRDFHNLWQRLFGKQKTEADDHATTTQSEQPPPRTFASYPDPFAQGVASRYSPEQLVRYTFEAFEAWGRDHGCPRNPEQTPFEFAQSISTRNAALAQPARALAELYTRLAYAPGPLPASSVEHLKQVWATLRR
jgi:hypothetical protein